MARLCCVFKILWIDDDEECNYDNDESNNNNKSLPNFKDF